MYNIFYTYIVQNKIINLILKQIKIIFRENIIKKLVFEANYKYNQYRFVIQNMKRTQRVYKWDEILRRLQIWDPGPLFGVIVNCERSKSSVLIPSPPVKTILVDYQIIYVVPLLAAR